MVYSQGSHSFTDKNAGLSRTPMTNFPDLFLAHKCLIVMTHRPASGICFWYRSAGTRNWSVCHTFLVPKHVQFRAGNRLESWTV